MNAAADLQGKKALITGASQGLGLAIADAYAAAGADLAICARDSELLNAAAGSLRAKYPAVAVHTATTNIADRTTRYFPAPNARSGG